MATKPAKVEKVKATGSLMNRILASVPKSRAAVLSQSNFFTKEKCFSSRIPLINLMISGHFNGGISPGIHQLVGESRTFKTNFCLSLMRDFLDSDPEAIAIFIDSEFGASQYFEAFGIDANRVVHIPVETLEEMKFQTTQILEGLTEKDNVFFFIDSVSQIASKKEAENALTGNEAADMTRAREMNSFFRIITPKLQIRKIPLFAINSFYTSMSDKWADPTIKGGKQIFLSSDVILFVTRSKIKDEDDEKKLAGWSFNYSALKSRYVKEKSKFSVLVTYDGGIDKNTGLFDLAKEAGYIKTEKVGWYTLNGVGGYDSTKSWRKRELETTDGVWEELLNNKQFCDFCSSLFALEQAEFLEDDEEVLVIDPETGEVVA